MNFFINKAIGWALREYSKTDREWVRKFIQQNTLKPLSIREGSKYLQFHNNYTSFVLISVRKGSEI